MVNENVPEEKQSNVTKNSTEYYGARAVAVRILSRFERSDAYLDKLLTSELNSSNFNSMDKALLTELVNGVVRWRWKIDWILTGFYHGDYLKCLNIVKNALRIAIYQIFFLDRIPIHAAINETVEIVKRIQGDKTAGIVNGVLRNIARNMNNVRYPVKEVDAVYYYTIHLSHPRWMVKRWISRYGEEAAVELLNANNNKPNLSIRINTMKTNPDEIIAKLTEYGLTFTQSKLIPQSFSLDTPGKDITSFDIYKDGLITIQDTAAMMAAMLAQPSQGQTIIDLCAAPGGKTFCLAEMMKNTGKVIAVDKYQSKLRFIEEGAKRLGYTTIQVMDGDATAIDLGHKADIVFADVPCSGLGTISKKPDIKWKREREDVFELAIIQKEILANAIKLLKPGGTLIYSTCTIEPEENIENINWLLENYPEFSLDPAEKYLPAEVCKDGFLQTLPHVHGMDGAFAARLIKRAE